MKGLEVFRNNTSLDKSTGNPNCAYELKAMDKGLEVMHMTMKAGSLLICRQDECIGTPNIYYILDGTLEDQGDKTLLKSGDCFSVKDIETTLFFKALNEVKILWIIGKNIFDELAYENRVIDKILNNIQLKDSYTHEHCQRVGHLSRQLGRKMGLLESRIVNTIIASMCHDVGKINVPAGILNKPDKLTEEEFNIIKKHSKDGSEIVNKELNGEIARIVEQHHERLDGRGYPYGIKGPEIITEAKILAVVDSFDAMISDRPYRSGISAKEAFDELKRCAGTHYESEIIDMFEEVLKEDGLI